MVATVGGDGTVLDASHFVPEGVPILGINSAVRTSLGHFCTASLANLSQTLDEILSGKRRPLSLRRLQVTLDGTPIPELILNEVRVKHKIEGETARYILHINKRQRTQLSDALFIGTASGATGWMHSYGWMLTQHGYEILPALSRRFLYLAQGLIMRSREDLDMLTGVLRSGDDIRVVSTMTDGVLMIDGRHISYPFGRGSELVVKPATSDVKVYLHADVNDQYKKLNKELTRR
jgi:NAD+ kinase